LFSKKKDIEPLIYSVEKCQSCGKTTKRKFQEGDYVYKSTSKCSKCSGNVMIIAIYGEYPPEDEKKQQ
jgi:hypothetical protein